MSRAFAMAGILFATVAAGCVSPVVGGECRDGFRTCDGLCVDLGTDPEHCGQCGNVCGEGAMCIEGSCALADGAVPDGDAGTDAGPGDAGDGGVPVDAGDGGDGGSWVDAGDGGSWMDAGDGGTDDGGTDDGGDGGSVDAGDGGTDDGGVNDGGTDGGPPLPCDVGEIRCGDQCVDPDTDRSHCGSCDSACEADAFCAEGVCTPVCDQPLTQCGGHCVDLWSDADHCGGCGIRCASGICTEGECSMGAVGHVVVIGHDYRTSRAGMNRVAGNAVFLATGAPVRVLVYEGQARPAAIRGVDGAIDQVARSTGRTWDRLEATAERVPLALAGADVLVILSQHGSTDAALDALGADWSMALDTFLRGGGVVVLFDGGGTHRGTWQLLDSAGLFAARGRTDVTGSRLDVTSPGDAVALNVPQSYRAEENTVWFDTEEPSWVVEHVDGPVVVHRVVFP